MYFLPFLLTFKDGSVSWSDLHLIYDQDSKLPANLRKANKLTCRAMQLGNNK